MLREPSVAFTKRITCSCAAVCMFTRDSVSLPMMRVRCIGTYARLTRAGDGRCTKSV
jgi:hypothetical protein